MQAIRPIGLAPVAPPATHAIDRAGAAQAAGNSAAPAFKDVLRASIERAGASAPSVTSSVEPQATVARETLATLAESRTALHTLNQVHSAAVQAFNEIKDLHI